MQSLVTNQAFFFIKKKPVPACHRRSREILASAQIDKNQRRCKRKEIQGKNQAKNQDAMGEKKRNKMWGK